ncbi:Fe(2+)/Mn(2+) transporter pcl1 [Tetrabaena socialis]|uniref:Fe(2+)/Mn(2+) transporter pcl1 n=1 Tax=Tetrabaena socialis TaxID=47790 RepID=A0A2J8AFB2_9CHLO|nr:Fe(2+)/Mn(2+) transporter pcl1 [Tetrabaena socialis]|eukprot:PNH11207.1 Fe(2+)/Mn(2+) transporter pcl1 [Tetrabaena socialis]
MRSSDPEAPLLHNGAVVGDTGDDDPPISEGSSDEHEHYSQRAPWLRAFVLGANDGLVSGSGLVSVAALMLGVGGGSEALATMRLAGMAAWIAGALSMAVGEYISVSSQRDTEEADVEKERVQQRKGPASRARELQELTMIYVGRGLDPGLARQVAEQLTEKDVIRAHARDELGINIDEMANPLQAAVVSAFAFTAGAFLPLVAGAFISDPTTRLLAVTVAAVLGLAAFGLMGALLGGSKPLVGALRVGAGCGGCRWEAVVLFHEAPPQPERAQDGAVARESPAPEVSGASREGPDEHTHYSHRGPWLRAFVLGATDGLVSVAALMLGVGGGSEALSTMRLAGIAAWIAGALSMAVGEYISVSSQRDTEEADVEKERVQQTKGPEARACELQELTMIYVGRGLDPDLARQVAEQLTEKDVIRAHARDELGIDLDEMANPLQAAVVSGFAFTAGAVLPLLAGAFIAGSTTRLIAVAAATVLGLAAFGLAGALLGGSKPIIGTLRVVIGGCLAMAITYGVGRLLGAGAV